MIKKPHPSLRFAFRTLSGGEEYNYFINDKYLTPSLPERAGVRPKTKT
jgi:hypothetical protein